MSAPNDSACRSLSVHKVRHPKRVHVDKRPAWVRLVASAAELSEDERRLVIQALGGVHVDAAIEVVKRTSVHVDAEASELVVHVDVGALVPENVRAFAALHPDRGGPDGAFARVASTIQEWHGVKLTHRVTLPARPRGRRKAA